MPGRRHPKSLNKARQVGHSTQYIMPSIDDSKCILVTGGTAGIGRALALALAKLPSKPRVIVVGRRKSRLEELAKCGLETVEFDINTDSGNLKKFADSIVQKYPEVSRLIY